MTTTLKIDFVSDIACPWCAVGLASLEKALERLQGEVKAELHFQPFELNPQMGPGGQDLGEHLTEKYGSTPEQQAEALALVVEMNASGELGSPVVTEVQPLQHYSAAEAYHQDYFEQHPNQGYCAFVVGPKVEKCLTTFKRLIQPG